jgi:phenylpropionate dioxygenase-like ring-hydroxylating dioxygenase large terminal subunit
MTKATVNVERPLAAGLRNCWYPLARSEDVGQAPLGVMALGEELVLWRDASGRAHAMTDRCPHRDTKLSLGEVVNGALTCAYHGFQFDASGQCIAIPSEGGACPLTRRFQVASYPTEERAGLVFGYVGDIDLFPPGRLHIPEELEHPAWSGFISHAEWGASWLRIIDNLADPMHGPFLHGRSYTLGRGARQDRLRVVDLDDTGFLVEREGQRGVNFDWVEIHLDGSLWCRLDIPYPWSAGPGEPLRIVGWVTPLDADRSACYFLRYRKLRGWKRNLWRSLYKLYLERNHWAVLEQDRVAMEAQRGIVSRVNEHLAPTDVGTIRLRRLLQQELARQREVYARAGRADPYPPAATAPAAVAEPAVAV